MIDSGGPLSSGRFALVCYVPDEIGASLNALARGLFKYDNPEPHLTILPPRPLRVPIDEASRQIRNTIARFSAFTVKIGDVRRFPVTDVLYLDIDDGASGVRRLHHALNQKDLGHDEEFEFRPHLTLSQPCLNDAARLERQVQQAWDSSQCPRSFAIDHLVFLWVAAESGDQDWQRLWVERLGFPASAATARTS